MIPVRVLGIKTPIKLKLFCIRLFITQAKFAEEL